MPGKERVKSNLILGNFFEMIESKIKVDNIDMPLYSLNTIVIGSGAAALNAAVNLVNNGQNDIAIITDDWGGGTSNNTGSDKQTYYKISLSGDTMDSPREMAKDLFSGGCMHGDIALCEAQNSARAFFYLVNLGVEFPYDRYGAYVGYKTDHDPRQRATSAGPLTSRQMFSALARDVKLKGIKVFDQHEIIALLTDTNQGEKSVVGAIALDKTSLIENCLGFVVFNAVNVVLGTGGPAGIYKTSVYPRSQIGSTGLAFEIGAKGQNLTESQFGLASTKFRWNLSGTYQQVIPRYVSTDQNGNNEREFLNDYFPDMGKLATAIFLKGYQWPFDPNKVYDYGSSLIDILVYRETVLKNRKAFLDFQRNPEGEGILKDFSFELLSKEAYEYLEKSGALFGTPIERLQKMNQPAIDLYKNNGIDLSKERLEIAVCAQHNNGGLKGNIWWESNIKHLFPVGEVNGTHGVFRPGGSALNSGQVGGLRCALYIAKNYHRRPLSTEDFVSLALPQIKKKFSQAMKMIDQKAANCFDPAEPGKIIRERMSKTAAFVREKTSVKKAVQEAWRLLERVKKNQKISTAKKLPLAFKNLDLCLTQAIYLEAIAEFLAKGGKSRGSFLVKDTNGLKPCPRLDDGWRFSLTEADSFVNKKILEIWLDDNFEIRKEWVDIRSIPVEDSWFENVWNEYLNDNIIK